MCLSMFEEVYIENSYLEIGIKNCTSGCNVYPSQLRLGVSKILEVFRVKYLKYKYAI